MPPKELKPVYFFNKLTLFTRRHGTQTLYMKSYFVTILSLWLIAGYQSLCKADNGTWLVEPEYRSKWVGEAVEEKTDNYYIYNCSSDNTKSGYLCGKLVNGKQTPVLTTSLEEAEMFMVQKTKDYCRIQRIKDNTYLYSNYSGFTMNATASNEFSTTYRDYDIELASTITGTSTQAEAMGRIYYIRYHVLFLNSYRYYYSKGGNSEPAYSISTSTAREWIFISEAQYEYRPKLDAVIAMVKKKHTPTSADSYYEQYVRAVEVQQSTTEAPQMMLYQCDALIKAFYADNETALDLWDLIVEAAELGVQLKGMLGEVPSDIKDAVTQSFVSLLSGDQEAMAAQVDKRNGTLPSLGYVYQSYLGGSLSIYSELLQNAQALGYSVPSNLMAEIAVCREPDDYEAAAKHIRDDFKNWMAQRMESGQGFPKNTDLSLLIVNNSFELGSENGWTIDKTLGYKMTSESGADITTAETNSYNVTNTGIVEISKHNVPNVHGTFYWKAYDIHEYTDRKGWPNNISYNINHGYPITQKITGLPAGVYRVSALVSLLDENVYPSDSNGKDIILKVSVNGTAFDQSITAEKHNFKTVSREIEIHSQEDELIIGTIGATIKKDFTGKNITKAELSYTIPYIVDNFQLTLVGALPTTDSGQPEGGEGSTPSNQGTAFTFDEASEVLPSFVVGAEYSRVVVKRTIKNSEYWNTLCLPFSLDEEQTAHYFGVVKELSSIKAYGDEAASLSFSAVQHIEAGKPYIVKVNPDNYPDGLTEIAVNDVTLVAEPEIVTKTDGNVIVKFQSVFVTVYGDHMPSTTQFLQNNEFFSFSNMTEEQITRTRSKGFRSFFSFDSMASEDAAAFHMTFVEEEEQGGSSAIEDIEESVSCYDIYDMNGRMVQQPKKGGIYIVNGKKMYQTK